MVLEPPRSPLVLKERRDPRPGAREIRFRVEACGVCRTDVRGSAAKDGRASAGTARAPWRSPPDLPPTRPIAAPEMHFGIWTGEFARVYTPAMTGMARFVDFGKALPRHCALCPIIPTARRYRQRPSASIAGRNAGNARTEREVSGAP